MAWAIHAGPRANRHQAGRDHRSGNRNSARTCAAFTFGSPRPISTQSWQPIEAGPSYDTVTAVEKGLAEGDQVIMTNYYRLQPNVPIRTDAQPVAVNEAGGRS